MGTTSENVQQDLLDEIRALRAELDVVRNTQRGLSLRQQQQVVIKHAAWMHGLGLELESPSWKAVRQGYYTTVTPSHESQSGWVHFVIPTPVIVDGVRLKTDSARVRFSTGAAARITNFHVFDGETKIRDNNSLSMTGKMQYLIEPLPKDHEVLWGTAICVGVKFDGTGPEAYVQFIAAGIDFY
ncbi:hypothetical protein BGX34_004024 [Mortierella sp. NVP85]|nr:hypothetical protein BGX34_004024 [Mortierella sp. NVP85]